MKIFRKTNIAKDCQGMTLLEIIVGVALVSMVTLSLYMSLFKAANLMGDSKQKIGAIALANERMEIIRNLEYDEIGIVGWVPNGPIDQVETVDRNGFDYRIETAIEYIDDPFDGEAPTDTISNDYKQAWVEVIWTSGGNQRSVLFTSKFVPDGLETDVGGGVLSINVIDGAAGQISGATVAVDSVYDTPSIHGFSTTDSTGNVRLQGMPEQEYQITISKSDYETVMTYANPPASAFTPTDPNVYVIDGDTVLKTITIDKSVDLLFKATDIADGDGISGVDLDILGGRVIGSDPTTYAIDQTESTDSSGEVDFNDIGSGTYDITNIATLETTDYQYVGTDVELPIALSPEDDVEVNLVFAEKVTDSLLLKLVDSVTTDPVSGATVNVTGSGPIGSFDQSLVTSTNGYAYFPVTEDPPVTMAAQDYDYDITVTGYQPESGTVSVSQLTIVEVNLTPL